MMHVNTYSFYKYLCILYEVTVEQFVDNKARAPLIRNSYIQPYLYCIIDRRFYCRLMRCVIEKPRARKGKAARDKAVKCEIYFIARR